MLLLQDMSQYHYKCKANFMYDICRFYVWIMESNEDDGLNITYSKIIDNYNTPEWEFKCNFNYEKMIKLIKKANIELEHIDTIYKSLYYYDEIN